MKTSKKRATILVGDIGGTRTRLALYEHPKKTLLHEAVRPSREHATFDEIALAFLAEAGVGPPRCAVLGVAGPVRDGTALVTNLPWQLDARALQRRLLIPTVRLLNDLVVAAVGCLHAPAASVVPLTHRRPSPRGHNCAVIAAGTGLGEARLIWTGDRHLPVGSEGGHADYAPQTPLEFELWHFLKNRFPDHVSCERVVSGDGIGALYDFFSSRGRREPRAVSRKLNEGDRNAAITELGLTKAYRPAARAIEMFASIYGAEAGNFALRELATGGVFVVGNIARHVVPRHRDLFMDAFRQKGRFGPMLAEVPVAVVTDPMIGVHGALSIARDLLAEVDAAPPVKKARNGARPTRAVS
jgi:glucokinase